jgi:SHS2 domain-containing protein
MAWGRSLPELFENASKALYSLVIDPSTVRPSNIVNIQVSGEGMEDLMVRWLNELVFLFDTEHLLLCEFAFSRIDTLGLDASCKGETVSPDRHLLRCGIKSSTYHGLEFKRVEGDWFTRVYLDL